VVASRAFVICWTIPAAVAVVSCTLTAEKCSERNAVPAFGSGSIR
jgi:hypothetical protein